MILEDSKNQLLEDAIAQYGRLILTICRSMTGDSFEAEDLTQDTFLSAYRNMDAFDGGNMKAWLVRIASNKCKDYLKSSARRNIPAPANAFEEVADRELPPEDAIVDRDAEKRIKVLSSSLREPYQSIAVAYFCEHRTALEISGATGKNLKTVQTQIYRTRAMLQKLWREESG